MSPGTYYAEYHESRIGWMVLRTINEVTSKLISGPFESEDQARNEADRLNGERHAGQ